VLIRLHTGNFNFEDVKADGSDLRFVAGDDRTPLKFHIEKWSPDEEQALVWVDVANLQPGQAAAVYAYYGSEDARPGQDMAGTYGADYRLIYHFANTGAPADATSNGLNGQGGTSRNGNGLIGSSLVLDGLTPLTLPAAALGAGPFTVSAWVKPSAAGGQLLAVPGGPVLTVTGGQLVLSQGGSSAAGAALPADRWSHVALVHDGQVTRLFIAGQPAGELSGAVTPAGPVVIGQGLVSELDELRVASVALPQGAL
jgi:biopolymer transport protein ExbB